MGLAAAGERGVEHVANIYHQEIKETLQLLGVSDVRALNRSYVDFPGEWNNRGTAAAPTAIR